MFKHIIRYLTVLSLLAPTFAFNAHAQETAATIMQRCADKFNNAPSLTLDFAIADAAKPFSGILTISRSKFKLSSDALSIWFDGKTQWAYLVENKEVNISEPTAEELLETNPFEIIRNFSKLYKCRKLKSPSGSNIIELQAKSPDASIKSAKVTISRATGWPTAIFARLDNGKAISVAIKGVKTGKTLPESTFKFNKNDYPTVEIVDLR